MTRHNEKFRSREGQVPPVSPPHRVRVPLNVHRWDRISFLHWPFEPRDVAPLVPDKTEVLTFDGAAWVSLTPFVIHVRPPGPVHASSRFPETNVRTYVDGPGGEGLWFLHMEVTAAWFVAAMRSVGLPYVRQRMTVGERGGRVVYRSQPRASAPSGGHEIAVRPGPTLDPPNGGPFDRFVTARWAAYHRSGPLLLRTPVEHPPWLLRSADVEICEVAPMFVAAGLPLPTGPPIAHFSPGSTVNVGPPRVYF